MSFKFVRFEMKEGFDKEFDSLLRRHARGAGVVRADGDGAAAGASHLDADELSAFAEGAMPAPARVAAVSHLAECDECRGLAVNLARASGFEVASEKGAAAAAVGTGTPAVAGWRVWLSSLFAPRVLRYAAPMLALCVVGVVSYVALRSRQGAAPTESQVAQNAGRQGESAKDATAAAAPAGVTTANANTTSTEGLVARATDEALRGPVTSGTPVQPAQPGAGQAGAGAPVPASPADAASAQPAPPPPAEAVEVTSAPPAAKAGPVEEREAEKKAENRAAKADDSKDKSAREPEPVETAANTEQYAQKRAQSRALEAQMPDGSRNRSASNQSNIGGGLAARPAPKAEDRDNSASRGAASRRSSRQESSGERSDDEPVRAGETRNAAGHRFRREGNVWVDVNYRPSMSPTSVRRGTESYRVLVADMPEIGRAAEQLGGEVVIVIHGRAYRIR